jgi:hypothetical protein
MNSVIGIFDMDNTTVSKRTRDFLANAEKNGRIIDITDDLPKSFVVVKAWDGEIVYISSLAPRTLMRRVKSGNFIV